MKTVTALRLQRLGKHRVLAVLEGAARRAPLPGAAQRGSAVTLLAVVKKAQYVDAQGTDGQAHEEALRGAGRPVVLNVRRA